MWKSIDGVHGIRTRYRRIQRAMSALIGLDTFSHLQHHRKNDAFE